MAKKPAAAKSEPKPAEADAVVEPAIEAAPEQEEMAGADAPVDEDEATEPAAEPAPADADEVNDEDEPAEDEPAPAAPDFAIEPTGPQSIIIVGEPLSVVQTVDGLAQHGDIVEWNGIIARGPLTGCSYSDDGTECRVMLAFPLEQADADA